MKVCRLCRRYAAAAFERCPSDGGELLEGALPPFAPGAEVGPFVVSRAFAAGATGVLLEARRREEPDGDEGAPRAEDAEPARGRVLLKVLAPVEAGVDARRSLVESAAALAAPGLLPVLEIFDAEGHLVAVRPFVEGSTLAARLKVDGPLDEAGTLALAARLTEILTGVHRAGLVHGDLRPGHLLVPSGGGPADALLLDLGAPSPPGALAAPELFGGGPASRATDVYGLCMTLYTCLAGRSPFRADNSTELGWLVRSSPPPPLRVMRAAGPVSPPLERLILWGLLKEPADRPSIEELAVAVQAATTGDAAAAQRALARASALGVGEDRRPLPGASAPPARVEERRTARFVRKLLPASVLRSTGLTQSFFAEGEELEREVARAAEEEAQGVRENTLAWVRAIAFLLIGLSLAALAVWGLTR